MVSMYIKQNEVSSLYLDHSNAEIVKKTICQQKFIYLLLLLCW